MSRTILMASLLAGFAVPAMAATETFHATLNAATEVPPTKSSGKGTADVTLDSATKQITYTVTYDGLTGPATAAHFHGPAKPGATAGVAVPFSGPVATPIKGTATLTDAQIKDLEAGMYYINIHTAANPNGEIRGQVAK